ncbi:gustatory receptor for bitter taste 66a [Teleopsis dalmanni]|uniref:gustatory receptor for bitter taste 66a n=1 Tax=Teleopsis dalmanni TaxID=139649 RepID=UPI0018CE6D9A|nr:gustatory receptor for bitter taste 66a [Teleopsis dalmanni]
MAQRQVQSLLLNFDQIFLICKILGIYPQDWQAFKRQHVLQKSTVGGWIVAASMVAVVACYNLLIYSFSEEDRLLKENQSTLTFVIGLFLTYIGLVMMATDQLTAIRNQNDLSDLFERIRLVDERLYKENIIVDNSRIGIRIRVMICFTIACELAIMASTYAILVEYANWMSLLWVFSCIPTLYNSLDKIWFAVTLYALKLRFEAINIALEDLVETHEKFKLWVANGGSPSDMIENISGTNNQIIESNSYEYNLGYLYKELSNLDAGSFKGSAKNKVAPIAHSMNSFGEGIETPSLKQKNPMINMAYESELNNIPRIEEKLNNFCQLHDEICEIGKTLNELWSYPILVLMAYGFLIFTAQLYFLYCATQEQVIPSLFRSAKNAIITALFLSYTAGKCIYLIYLSWKTSLESKRTGICLHKCGVVADDCVLYEIVNHLSLKLLNHSVNFSACGFFTLDMETLYAVSGGITSYLIILIQFNLAAQQAKDAIRTFSNFNETANLIASGSNENTTVFMDFLTTTIMSTISN